MVRASQEALILEWEDTAAPKYTAVKESLETKGWSDLNYFKDPEQTVWQIKTDGNILSITRAGPCEVGKAEPCIPVILDNPNDPSIPTAEWFWSDIEDFCDVASDKPCGEATAACQQRKARACLALATQGRADTRGLAEKAALLGNPEGYLFAAQLLWQEDAPYTDLATASKQLAIACTKGIKEACALQQTFEQEVDLEAVGAAEFSSAQALCESGEDCGRLAAAYEDGVGTERDLAMAVTIQHQSCERGDGELCFGYGQSAYYGRGTAKDQAAAREAFRLGCEVDHNRSCRWLGELMLWGHGGPVDAVAGKAVLQKACRLGNADACSMVNNL